MKKFKKLNNIIGWVIFLIATFVYLATMEKTASLWDCGEFISAAFKLEVVHAPGAPFFLLLGRLFSLFAADVSQVAMTINAMSALASSFTILFLFWTITSFGRKIYLKKDNTKRSHIFAVLGAGIVGSLAYTFSDSFWFSAVEGEVYALSSFFTAVTFWCILKWEEVSGSPHASKWLVLIAYLIGLSIGVHLLSLLTIPAMAMIYYFKNNKYSHWGAIKALAISSFILLFIQGIFIPKTASLMGWFDVFFVNNLGMPFNSGSIFFIILLLSLIIFGIAYTTKNNKPTWNTALLSILVLLIGYSSYTTVLIRSNAQTPINIGAPSDPLKLSSYLQREQYGEVAPLLFGRYYYDDIERDGNGRPVTEEERILEKNIEAGEYEELITIDKYKYAKDRFFSRMYSSQTSPNHIAGYQSWAPHNSGDIKFSDNLKFFWRYQVNWSYMRYFMWNFAGRQNDVMNMDGNEVFGNWESGIGYSSEGMPSELKDNKAKNHYFFLPLLIGLVGVFFHFKSQKTDALSVLLFFLFTGIFIILYLNVPPYQPRERDYAYVGSFYAFAIWIGIGVLGIFDLLKRMNALNGRTAAVISTISCLIAAPLLMATENWDDHNRTGRSIAFDVGKNYLSYLDSNAIIFSNGDNDTYPLWYVQEVEGIGVNAKNVNMSLLGMSYYIDQVKRKTYSADGVPSQLTHSFFKGDLVNMGAKRVTVTKSKKYVPIKEAIKRIDSLGTCPKKIKIPINNKERNNPLWSNKTIPESIKLTIKGKPLGDGQTRILDQSNIALLDILANFNWERPLYFISAQQTLDLFIIKKNNDPGLLNYLQTEGAVQRLVPFNTYQERVNIDKSYDLLMNKYNYGNINDENIYVGYYTDISISSFRKAFVDLSKSLLEKTISDTLMKNKAISLADKYFEELPYSTGYLDYNYQEGVSHSVIMAGIYLDIQSQELDKLESKFNNEYNYQDSLEYEIAKLEINAKYSKAKTLIDKMHSEYTTQKSYLSSLPALSGQANSLLQITNENIKKLDRYRKRIENNEGRKLASNISDMESTNEESKITESGLTYKVINKGNGDTYPSSSSTVTVHYTGRLIDGAIFDSSVERGEPATFALNQVIPGWTEALQLMRVGDKWEVTIPSDLAYGKNGVPQAGIGPNATLIFEIELLAIQ